MDSGLNKNGNKESNTINQESLTSLEFENSNKNQPIEMPYYEINKKSPKKYITTDENIKCILCLSIMNLIIVPILIFVDILTSESFDFVNQIYVYINRIIMIIISLWLLITYKNVSIFIRKAKFIILIINLFLGIILRILQANVDKKFSEFAITKIILYFFFCAFQINFVFWINLAIK